MAALLNDLTVLHHQDQIRLADGGKSVGNDKGSVALQKLVCGLLYQLFRLSVNGGCGLIQYKYTWVCQDCPGKRYKLFLACGQSASALPHIALVSFFPVFLQQYQPKPSWLPP